MIRQTELAQLSATLFALSDLESAARLQKQDIVARIDAGEPIERGKLSALILETVSRRFSESAVAAVLGPRAAADLKAQLPESTSRALKIIQS